MRSVTAVLFALPLFALPLLATAQNSSAHSTRPEDYGTVTGHVTCSDTQRPARVAEVRLVPVMPTILTEDEKSGFGDGLAQGNQLPPVETDMSGGYILRNVVPGDYYLRVDYIGYITPLTSFTRAQLSKPAPDVQQRMQRDLQIIRVTAHATTQADSVLLRGAAVSGSVLYDDGSPAIGLHVALLSANEKGEYNKEYQTGFYTPPTDDQGRFRIDSIPPGKYIVAANLSFNDHSTMSMPSPDGKGAVQMTMTRTWFSLPIYSGSVLRRRDAIVIDATAGQEIAYANLTVPLSKLHPVSGSLLAPDGHTVNAGKVRLLHQDDREELTSVDIRPDDQQFHFPYVPEDTYALTVSGARDTKQVEVENAKGITPPSHFEEKTMQTYGDAEQTLKVETDTTGVLVQVPAKKAATTSAATTGSGTTN